MLDVSDVQCFDLMDSEEYVTIMERFGRLYASCHLIDDTADDYPWIIVGEYRYRFHISIYKLNGGLIRIEDIWIEGRRDNSIDFNYILYRHPYDGDEQLAMKIYKNHFKPYLTTDEFMNEFVEFIEDYL